MKCCFVGESKNAGSRERSLLLGRENGKEVRWNAGGSTTKGVIFDPVGKVEEEEDLG